MRRPYAAGSCSRLELAMRSLYAATKGIRTPVGEDLDKVSLRAIETAKRARLREISERASAVARIALDELAMLGKETE